MSSIAICISKSYKCEWMLAYMPRPDRGPCMTTKPDRRPNVENVRSAATARALQRRPARCAQSGMLAPRNMTRGGSLRHGHVPRPPGPAEVHAVEGIALVLERATEVLQLTAKPRRDPLVKLAVQAKFLADHQPDFDR